MNEYHFLVVMLLIAVLRIQSCCWVQQIFVHFQCSLLILYIVTIKKTGFTVLMNIWQIFLPLMNKVVCIVSSVSPGIHQRRFHSWNGIIGYWDVSFLLLQLQGALLSIGTKLPSHHMVLLFYIITRTFPFTLIKGCKISFN